MENYTLNMNDEPKLKENAIKENSIKSLPQFNDNAVVHKNSQWGENNSLPWDSFWHGADNWVECH